MSHGHFARSSAQRRIRVLGTTTDEIQNCVPRLAILKWWNAQPDPAIGSADEISSTACLPIFRLAGDVPCKYSSDPLAPGFRLHSLRGKVVNSPQSGDTV